MKAMAPIDVSHKVYMLKDYAKILKWTSRKINEKNMYMGCLVQDKVRW
jgi:hypothetical protein